MDAIYQFTVLKTFYPGEMVSSHRLRSFLLLRGSSAAAGWSCAENSGTEFDATKVNRSGGRVPPSPIPEFNTINQTWLGAVSAYRTESTSNGLPSTALRSPSIGPTSSGDRTELSMRRTGMSFQRTRMSAERTLMSVIRTSLSLISFGFTIFQVFEKLRDAGTITHAAAPRNFGVTLVALGIVMLVLGIVYHIQFMLGLRHERDARCARTD